MSAGGDHQLVIIESGQVLTQPMILNQKKLTLVLKDNAEATVIEYFDSSLEGNQSEAELNITQDHNSKLKHYRIQTESSDSNHQAIITNYQARDTFFSSFQVYLGAHHSTTKISSQLGGPGAQCQLRGLYLGSDKQIIKVQTFIDHQSPHTDSATLYKGILDDEAKGFFNGRVIVRPKSQKITSTMLNHNLLLSKSAQAYPQPDLEIYADDVKCSHGATVGQLDQLSLFYLRSRGMDETRARDILIQGFIEEMLEQVELEELRRNLTKLIGQKLAT